MPTRKQTITDAIRIFESVDYPQGLDIKHVWLGVYQTLLWYEPVNWLGYIDLPHIIDADKLRPSSPAKRRRWTRPTVWQNRSQAISEYLADQLKCSIESLPDKMDLLMKLPHYQGMQRQNTLGIAFAGLIKYIVENFGSRNNQYETEVEASQLFPGISFPGRSSTPRIDLLIKRNDIPRAIISAKWSLRHDRLNDITNECPVYKAAYERVYRSLRRDHMLYFVVTNEYDPSRLSKILGDTCIDGIIHVHKMAVVSICNLDGRLANIIDLTDFIEMTKSI